MKERNLFLLCLLPLLGWWLYGLFDLDEGFYAAVVTEMNARGEWITPYYNGAVWYEKPILLYWLSKPFLMLSDTTFAARLPGILSTIGVYVLVLWFGKEHLDRLAVRPVRPSHAALFVIATTLLFVGVGRMMMTDMPLVFCLTAAFMGFWQGLTRDPKAWLWAGAAMGASVLAKGPVGIILFVPISWYAFRITKTQPKPSLGITLGAVAIALAVIAAWYVPAYLKDGPVFVQKFLVEQNLNRFTGGDTAHASRGLFDRLFFFVIILIVGMAPWSWLIRRSWPKRASDPVFKYLAACALIPFLFFTVGSAKLVHYILPCFPFLALLIGYHLTTGWSAWPRWTWGWLGAFIVLMNGGMLAYYRFSGHQEIHALAYKVKGKPEEVAAYQMPRREKGYGKDQLKIQENSHPSLQFVLGKPFVAAETLDDLNKVPMPLNILTRSNRFDEADIAALRQRGYTLTLTEKGADDNYRLYRLELAKPTP